MRKRKRLPNKPSKLIRIALKDLEDVENTPSLTVNMTEWLDNSYNYRNCQVCLAGSVMLKTLRVPVPRRGLKTWPGEGQARISERTAFKLYALNNWKNGTIEDGLDNIGIRRPKGLRSVRKITPYDTDPKKFKKGLIKLSADFERFGL